MTRFIICRFSVILIILKLIIIIIIIIIIITIIEDSDHIVRMQTLIWIFTWHA